jgi:hypothetical protein
MMSAIRTAAHTLLAFLAAIVLSTAAGCQGDDSVSSGNGLTEGDAATIVASSFGTGTSTNGLTGQIESGASLATGGTFGKLDAFAMVLRETTITRQKTSGVYTYNYTFHVAYGLAGESFDVQYGMRGTYATPRVSSDDSAYALLHFTNLLANPLTLNGTYVRLGSETFRVGDADQLTTALQATLTNITIDRNTKRVTGGTVALSVTAARDDNSTITLTGTLTFLGNGLATLVLNGKTFSVNLDYAEADPA